MIRRDLASPATSKGRLILRHNSPLMSG